MGLGYAPSCLCCAPQKPSSPIISLCSHAVRQTLHPIVQTKNPRPRVRPRVQVCQLLATKASYLLSRRSSPAAYGKGCDRPQPPTTLENKRTMQTRPYSGSMREEGVFIICHRARKRCQGKPETPWSLEDVQTSGRGNYAGVPKGARNLHSSTVRH